MISREEFLQSLAESGLSGFGKLPALSPDADGTAMARELVAANLLTDYQAAAVLDRRFGDLRIGNYDLLDKIGAGGMGAVFRARHRRMKRVVALKVLSREIADNPAIVKRFQREVETVARLTHPNIVLAFDADEAEQGPFLVMEFVNGQDLAREVARAGPLDVADAVDCLLQTARGLAHAHAAGVVHRDVKPANILRDASGVIKITDLGIARLTARSDGDQSSALTQVGTVVGTVDYMAPEQASGLEGVDHRADIYSLGGTLHFLLTGAPPYRGRSPLVVLLEHRDAPIPSLRAVRPDVPTALDAVFQRMMAKTAADRHTTMDEVVHELERIEIPREHVTLPRSSGPGPGSQPGTTLVASPALAAEDGEFELNVDERPPAAAQGQTIVVVQPSRTQAAIISKQLRNLKLGSVEITSSGSEAIDRARLTRARVIIASMYLADMTGAQLAQRLLTDPACGLVGVVLTSSEDADSGEALPATPRVAILHKPFDDQRLAAAIAAVLG